MRLPELIWGYGLAASVIDWSFTYSYRQEFLTWESWPPSQRLYVWGGLPLLFVVRFGLPLYALWLYYQICHSHPRWAKLLLLTVLASSSYLLWRIGQIPPSLVQK